MVRCETPNLELDLFRNGFKDRGRQCDLEASWVFHIIEAVLLFELS